MKDNVSLTSSISTQQVQQLLPALPVMNNTSDPIDANRAREILGILRERREILTSALLDRTRVDRTNNDTEIKQQRSANKKDNYRDFQHRHNNISPTSVIDNHFSFANFNDASSHPPCIPTVISNEENLKVEEKCQESSQSAEDLIRSLKQKRERMYLLLKRVEQSINKHKKCTLRDLSSPTSTIETYISSMQEEREEDYEAGSTSRSTGLLRQKQQKIFSKNHTATIPKELHCVPHLSKKSCMVTRPLNTSDDCNMDYHQNVERKILSVVSSTFPIEKSENIGVRNSIADNVELHGRKRQGRNHNRLKHFHSHPHKNSTHGPSSFLPSQLDVSTYSCSTMSLDQKRKDDNYFEQSTYISTSTSSAESTLMSSRWSSDDDSSCWEESDTITTIDDDHNSKKVIQVCHYPNNSLASSLKHYKDQQQIDDSCEIYVSDSSKSTSASNPDPSINIVSAGVNTEKSGGEIQSYPERNLIFVTDVDTGQSDASSPVAITSFPFPFDVPEQADTSNSSSLVPSSLLSYAYKDCEEGSPETYASDSSGSSWYSDPSTNVSPTAATSSPFFDSPNSASPSSFDKLWTQGGNNRDTKSKFNPYTLHKVTLGVKEKQEEAIPDRFLSIDKEKKCPADISLLTCESTWDRSEKSPQVQNKQSNYLLEKKIRTQGTYSNYTSLYCEEADKKEPRAICAINDPRAMHANRGVDVSLLSMSSMISLSTFSVLAGGMYHIAKLSGSSKEELYSTIDSYKIINDKIIRSPDNRNYGDAKSKLRPTERESIGDNDDNNVFVAGGMFHLAIKSGFKFDSSHILPDTGDGINTVGMDYDENREKKTTVKPDSYIREGHNGNINRMKDDVAISIIEKEKIVKYEKNKSGYTANNLEKEMMDVDFGPTKARGGHCGIASFSNLLDLSASYEIKTKTMCTKNLKVMLPERVSDLNCASSGSLYDIAGRSGLTMKRLDIDVPYTRFERFEI